MPNSQMISIVLTLLVFTLATNCRAGFFAVARIHAPVLNSSDFISVFGGKDGSSLKTDRCGQVRELEYIAIPGTAFKILREFKRGTAKIYQVETEDYPAPTGIRLYVDGRFLQMHSKTPPPRKRSLPTLEQVLSTLVKSIESPYVWGGNVQNGVPELSPYFYQNVSNSNLEKLTLAGLDCSGLLYQATGGWTPRNTSQLISFGRPITIKGKNAEEIAELLEPLDLIVWNGHVIIVLDKQTVIESRLECGKPRNGGVMTTSLQKRLTEIMQNRRPEDSWPSGKKQDVFVVRRWF